MVIDDMKLKLEEQRAMLGQIEKDPDHYPVLSTVTRSTIAALELAIADLEWLDSYHAKRHAAMLATSEANDDWERQEEQERDDEYYAYLAEE